MSVHAEMAAFVSERTGIELSRGGIDRTLQSVSLRRQKELGLTARAYLTLLASERSSELERLVNAITVGYTWFFRDPGQFATLEALLGSELATGRKVRIWVPACSTGEDPYTVAFIAARSGRQVEILATDLNSNSVEHAQRGVYSAWSVRDVDPRFAGNFVRRSDGKFEVRPEIRERVTFAQHNLIERAPTPSDATGWDIVLCRNVLIYFEREVALGVLESLTRALSRDGYLVLGASEVVCEVPNGLNACYVANRLVFRRGERARASGNSELRMPARDWLMQPATQAHPARVVSALPTSASALSDSVPPPAQAAVPELERELSAGHQLLEAGDVAAARARYLAALERDSTRADAHMYVGVARYLCGEVERALHHLRAALFLDDGLWPAAFYLALCHENSGHPAEALQGFRHVVRLDSRDRAARLPLGSVFDAWREDLCELARRRCQAAGSAQRQVG
ncbi:MAG TPA: CheR family methyltransferase [Polyangiaceae bacterium]|nr:CheR family methyltransferase [Polyangiaceae bacterium]